MSKAILILDMPDSCKKCEFCDKNVHLSKVCHAKVENSEEYGLYYREIENGVKKPVWCPLQKMPDKNPSNPELKPGTYYREDVYEVYKKGWNDLYEKIME